MSRLYPALLEAAFASLVLIPLFLYQKNNSERHPMDTLLLILFSLYLSVVYSIAGLPSVLYVRYHPNLNMTPFLYMFSDHTTSLLNVLLFVPFGFFLPVLWKGYRKVWQTLLAGLLISLSIEFLQLFTHRATDVNDLITNTCGTLLGYFCGILLVKLIPVFSKERDIQPLWSVLGNVFLVMFLIQPVLLKLLPV